MDRGMLLFWGGMVLVVALFIPMTVLQDSRSPAASQNKKVSKRCPPFQPPEAVVGEFICRQRRKTRHGELHACRLECPSSLQPRPLKHRVLHRCHKGQWTVAGQEEVYCVAKKSVSLVEQQSASPLILNNLLQRYLNLSNNYLVMVSVEYSADGHCFHGLRACVLAYVFDRADVQLPGFHHYFLHLWQKTMDQARSVMAYINKRGGWIDMRDLPRPQQSEILHMGQEAGFVGLVAMETAVSMERESQRQILKMLKLLEKPKNNDPHMLHILEHEHLKYEVNLIKELVDYVTQLRSFQESGEEDYKLGEYELDSHLK